MEWAKAAIPLSISPASSDVDRAYIYSKWLCRGPDGTELSNPGRISRVTKHSHSCYIWSNLLEKLQPFRTQTVFKQHKARGVATWAGQRIDEASAHWIGNGHEHDWQRASGPLQRRHSLGSDAQNDIRRNRDQLRRVFAVPLDIVLAPADVEPNIAAVVPAQLLEGLLESHDGRLTVGIARCNIHQHADAPHLIGLR